MKSSCGLNRLQAIDGFPADVKTGPDEQATQDAADFRMIVGDENARDVQRFDLAGRLLAPRERGHGRHQFAGIHGLCEMKLEAAEERFRSVF